MEENIKECLSKLIQARFYWLSCHIVRGIFLGLLDDKNFDFLKGTNYTFSKDDPEQKYPIDWFINVYIKNPIQDQREPYMIFLRRTIILEVQTEIEECFKNKGIELSDLKLSDDELNAFRFLGLSRIVLFHWDGLKKNDGKPITWNNITIDNSKEPLKIKDADIDSLIKTLIDSLVKRLPQNKIINQDLRMSVDIHSIQKIAQKRFNDYDNIMKSYFG